MRRFIALVFLVSLCTAGIHAQEYRGMLLGVVTDPSNAAVPGAQLQVRNTVSGVGLTAIANGEGYYFVPNLLPGSYEVSITHPGFRTFERGPIEIRVNDRVRIDAVLELGEVSDRVTVTAETPLLEASSANRGQVIENRSLIDLPLSGRNPFSLMNLAPGVQYNGSLQFFRGFDNSATSSFSINGGRSGQNEFQIDGMPDTFNNSGSGSTDGRGNTTAAYTPPVEATQEFKIQTNAYDAQYGRTSGGVISVSIKSGTNRYHGAAYDYLKRTGLEANSFGNNAARLPRARHSVDQFGFELDGPVRLPKLYNGRDRTFFTFAFEKYHELSPTPALGTVPTQAERDGDFSQTFRSNGQAYAIYDPATIRVNPNFDPAQRVSLTNPQYLRTAFANNAIPARRMDPVALRVLKDIPLPNQAGDSVTHQNNWYGASAGIEDDFKNLIARLDHTFSERWRSYARWAHNYRNGGRQNYTGWNTPAAQLIHLGRRNDSVVVDVDATLSSATIFNARLGFTRFEQLSFHESQDISSLGFPASLVAQLQIPDRYPVFTFENYLQAGYPESDIQPSETYAAQTGVIHTAGRHSMKAGFEYRLMHAATLGRNNGSGTYNFSRGWTSSNPQVNDPATGNAVASFLLGDLSSASVRLNPTPYLSWRYPIVYYQDDWQVTRRVSVNLGLRWDYETPPVERHDRQNRGFDFSAVNPLQDQVPGLALRGGLLFAGRDGVSRQAFHADRNNWQPRAGIAWKPLEARPLVIRGGAGRFFLPAADYGGVAGFLQTTAAQTSTADFRPLDVLSNPFPQGLIQPPGAALGLRTGLGDAITFNDPSRDIGNIWLYSAGVEYELRGWLVEASYSGSQTRNLPVTRALNFLTLDQLALGTPHLSAAVTNPFYGVLPANTTLGRQATLQQRSLLVDYPQFTSVTENDVSIGKSWYNAAQFRVERRFHDGLSLLGSYTISKTMDATSFLNPQDTRLDRELASFDVPQRLVVSGVYELPFGRNKRLMKDGWLSYVLGGWQFNAVVIAQSGTPMPLPDYTIAGDPRLTSGQTLSRWFDTSAAIWQARSPDTLRTAPLRSPNIRKPVAPQVDATLVRNFRVREGHALQFRASAYNLSNTPAFNFPNTNPASPLFGMVVSPASGAVPLNTPRVVELGFRYSF